MFPGRFPTASENMWTFWNPQAMGLQGQFCGGDLMNQQSQAQLQAQTQAQLAALREQNNILNQQLGVQAQTHIQHLQQLLPFHQSTFHPHPSQPTAPVPDPPTPVAPQSTPPASSASFNAEEMMQQMKNTVESSMQAFVDKTQERNMNQPPAPAQPPIQASPPTPSHPPLLSVAPPQPQHPPRRSRSRSHRHRGAPDKRPVSIPRSPRRATPLRRTYPFLSGQDHHTDVDTQLQEIHPDVPVELLLSICDQPLHVVEKYGQTMTMTSIVGHPAANQLHFIQHRGNTNDTIRIHPTHHEYYQDDYPSYDQPPTSGNPGTNGRTLHNPNLVLMHRGGLTIPRLPPNINATMTHPTSCPTNLSLHFPPTVHAKTHTDPAQSNRVYPPVLSLQDGSKERMGSSCRACFESSRQDASCQWIKPEEPSFGDQLYATRSIWCRKGTAPSGPIPDSQVM